MNLRVRNFDGGQFLQADMTARLEVGSQHAGGGNLLDLAADLLCRDPTAVTAELLRSRPDVLGRFNQLLKANLPSGCGTVT